MPVKTLKQKRGRLKAREARFESCLWMDLGIQVHGHGLRGAQFSNHPEANVKQSNFQKGCKLKSDSPFET